MGFIVTRNYHDCYKSDNNIILLPSFIMKKNESLFYKTGKEVVI